MNWKTSDFRNFLKWSTTFFEEDNGKASTKRIIAWALAGNCCYGFYRMVRYIPIADWNNSITTYITMFSMIASLLAFAYIPTRKDNGSI